MSTHVQTQWRSRHVSTLLLLLHDLLFNICSCSSLNVHALSDLRDMREELVSYRCTRAPRARGSYVLPRAPARLLCWPRATQRAACLPHAACRPAAAARNPATPGARARDLPYCGSLSQPLAALSLPPVPLPSHRSRRRSPAFPAAVSRRRPAGCRTRTPHPQGGSGPPQRHHSKHIFHRAGKAAYRACQRFSK